MKKEEFEELMVEATDEFKEEKKERIKDFLKERLREYEMAKATVKRLEKEFDKIKKEGLGLDESFLLE